MKKILSLLLVLCALLTLTVPALAVTEGAERVVLGADLTDDQILTVYSQLGLLRGSVPELKVTNAEERTYLQGLVSDSVIGTRSISCVYIKVLGANRGLSVTTTNISWCSEDMYRSALMTAGIFDAEVRVAAPFPVSGTAALTGIYKAYEDITGVHLEEEAKSVAADELIVTAELADALAEAGVDVEPGAVDMDAAVEQISNADAVAIVNELKLILDDTQQMSDAELRARIVDIASAYGYVLDDSLIDRLISLCRSMEGLSIADLTEKVEQFKSTVVTAQEYVQKAASFGQKLTDFFQSFIRFFQNLFG